MLRFAEELIFLLLDKDTGALAPIPDRSLRCALAGAVLMDLALEGRIDTDLERLFLVDSTPVGDDLLDPCLRSIAAAAETRDPAYWIDRMAEPTHADRVPEESFRPTGRVGHRGAGDGRTAFGAAQGRPLAPVSTGGRRDRA